MSTGVHFEHLTVFAFLSCLTAFRAQQGDLVRGACRIAPHEAFQIAAEWLRYEVTTPIDTGGSKCKYAKLAL